MPVPKDKAQFTSWLKDHGYKWVLRGPHGEVSTVPQAIQEILQQEEREQEERAFELEVEVADYILILNGVYASSAVWRTGQLLKTYPKTGK